MIDKKVKYVWAKQTISPDFELIKCPIYDEIKDFNRDPSGCYVLIRVDKVKAAIEVAICDKDHNILKAFRGKKSQDLYHTIFVYEKKHRYQWFKCADHIAYLGKELKKAEYGLASDFEYIQE